MDELENFENKPKQENHEMILDKVHPSGIEEWYCPTCGRRFMMNWPPKYSKVILEAGDETAIHSGGKSTEEKSPDPEASEILMFELDPETMEVWLEWLDKVRFEDWWKDNIE